MHWLPLPLCVCGIHRGIGLSSGKKLRFFAGKQIFERLNVVVHTYSSSESR